MRKRQDKEGRTVEEKNGPLSKLEKTILKYVINTGKINIKTASDITGAEKLVAKKALEKLRMRGFLEKLPYTGGVVYFAFASALCCIISDERRGKERVYIFSPSSRKSTVLASSAKGAATGGGSMLIERIKALTADKNVASCIIIKSVFGKGSERPAQFIPAFSPLDLLASYIGEVASFEKCCIAYFDDDEKALCIVRGGKTENYSDLSFLVSECTDQDEFLQKASEMCIRMFSPDVFLLASYGVDRDDGARIKDTLAEKGIIAPEIIVKDLTDSEIMRLAFEKSLGII